MAMDWRGRAGSGSAGEGSGEGASATAEGAGEEEGASVGAEGKRTRRLVVATLSSYGVGFLLVFGSLAFWGSADRRMAIGAVLPGSPAERSGLATGDLPVAIDDQPIGDRSLSEIVAASGGRALRITVERAGEKKTLSVQPQAQEGEAYRIGVGLHMSGQCTRIGLGRALWAGLWQPLYLAYVVVQAKLAPTERSELVTPIGIISELRESKVCPTLAPFSYPFALLALLVLFVPMGPINGGGVVLVVRDLLRRRT
jgi:regulator of sigma E protease